MGVELWAKLHGIKLRCSRNVWRNNLGTWGSLWEPHYNMMGTVGKKHKILTLQKEKN
jgi:hypothetical protein